MPKLKDQVVRQNQVAIEDAALRLFVRQGYFGTSIRDVATEAGVSVGNIYNYYPNKEALYESLIKRYSHKVSLEQAKLKPVLGKFDPESLRLLAQRARDIVYNNPDYWRLERIWRSLGLQSAAMKRDFLSNHVYEEIYCDALDRLLDGSPDDQVYKALSGKAVCTPDCCPKKAAKP